MTHAPGHIGGKKWEHWIPLFAYGRLQKKLEAHCRAHHDLPYGFEPASDVTWDMVHHLQHRLKGRGRR